MAATNRKHKLPRANISHTSLILIPKTLELKRETSKDYKIEVNNV
jgi:hypothetical protein